MLRAVLAWCVMWMVALFVPGRAFAQSFQLNALLIANPDSGGDAGLKAAGASLHSDLEQMLSNQYLVIPFAKVPAYQDYSAAVYLASCPKGDYVGCTFVLGQRAKADWVVAIQLSKDESGDEALFSIVDVKEARTVVSFSSKLTDDNHGAVAAGLSMVLDSVLHGADQAKDIRGQVEDPKAAWERRQAEAKKAAEKLAFSDQSLQILVRPDVGGYDQPKLKASQLGDWSQREDTSPWQKLGMSKSEYVRYKNSGKGLAAWRKLASGRKGRILVTLAGSFGSGSYRHVYDGRWILDDQTLQPLEVASNRQMQKGPSTAWRVELGYGITPNVEVGAGVAARTAKFDYFYQREIKGDSPQVIAQDETYRYTPEAEVYGGYIPFATLPVRPTGYVGLAYWQGSPISRVVLVQGPPEDSPRPRFLMLHIMPGVEASPNPYVSVFARFDTELLLVGSRKWSSVQGDATALTAPDTPNPLKLGGGWEITVGVTAHLDLADIFQSHPKTPTPAPE